MSNIRIMRSYELRMDLRNYLTLLLSTYFFALEQYHL